MINVNDNFIPSIFMKMTEWSWTSGSITGTLFDSRGKGGRHGGILNGKALQKEMGGGEITNPLFGWSVHNTTNPAKNTQSRIPKAQNIWWSTSDI